MLALLSLLDLVYMLRSTLAATLLKIIALPVPLLRQVYIYRLPPLPPTSPELDAVSIRYLRNSMLKSIHHHCWPED